MLVYTGHILYNFKEVFQFSVSTVSLAGLMDRKGFPWTVCVSLCTCSTCIACDGYRMIMVLASMSSPYLEPSRLPELPTTAQLRQRSRLGAQSDGGDENTANILGIISSSVV